MPVGGRVPMCFPLCLDKTAIVLLHHDCDALLPALFLGSREVHSSACALPRQKVIV